jgi:Arc-like DNA binding domain
MAQKRKRLSRSEQRKQVAHLRVRLPETLRHQLERAAAKNNRSMNQELISRLRESFHELGAPSLIAQALVDTLDDSVLDAMGPLILTKPELNKAVDVKATLIEAQTAPMVLTELELKDEVFHKASIEALREEMDKALGGDHSEREGPKRKDAKENPSDRPHTSPRQI